MPAPIALLLVFAMLATIAALCIRIALRRRRSSGILRRGAHVAGGDGIDGGWALSSSNDASSSTSTWAGAGGESGGAGATGHWDSDSTDSGSSDGSGGDGGGGGGD